MRCSWFPRGAADRTWTVYDALRPRSAPEPCAKHSNASASFEKLGALGLVVNAIVLWNTRYMDAVLSKLQADGDAIADADARRLSPLVHKHLNFLGRYHFSLPGDVRGGELRELRDPNAGLEEEWLLPVGSP